MPDSSASPETATNPSCRHTVHDTTTPRGLSERAITRVRRLPHLAQRCGESLGDIGTAFSNSVPSSALGNCGMTPRHRPHARIRVSIRVSIQSSSQRNCRGRRCKVCNLTATMATNADHPRRAANDDSPDHEEEREDRVAQMLARAQRMAKQTADRAVSNKATQVKRDHPR